MKLTKTMSGSWKRTHDWLVTLQDKAFTIDQRLQQLIIAHLCERTEEVEPRLVEPLYASLYDHSERMLPALREADPYLLLMALTLLEQTGHTLAPFQLYLREIANAVQEVANKKRPSVRIRLVQELVDRLLGEQTLFYEGDPLPNLDRIYDFSDEEITALCEQITQQTFFGQRRMPLSADERSILLLALPAIALAYLRDYKLTVGGEVLNALHYLGLADSVADQALPFLCIQQRPNGAFGFLSPEGYQQLRKRGGNVEAEVYLPITLTCLWTLTLYRERQILPHSTATDFFASPAAPL